MKRNKWTNEEIRILEENYKNGINFVSNLLEKHTKNSIINKAKELGLYVIYYDVDKLKDIVKDSYSFAEVCRKLNKSKSGDGYKVLKRVIENNSIDISHFDPWKNNIINKKNKEKPISFYLIENSNICSSHLKEKLYKNGLKDRICEQCDQGEDWRGKKMALILDHINGISNDNRLENLRILCPNCNATLETHCKGYKGVLKNIEKLKNRIKTEQEKQDSLGFSILERESQIKQRKAERPSYDILTDEINKLGYAATGRKYNVSDNSIRKWIKMYEKYGENF